ncbi:4a-hydroxytetrahydrobiopterin dehydratase [Zunongwangia sp.]|uniref:4a-hydroxytetrahydrobiopterin dehydratase n=1 Tax=Zunongwangia sp. TaxID=1965325 RepID=UPI003AA836C4
MEKLTDSQINEKLESLDGWTYSKNMLHISLEFENFKDTFTVMTRIAFEAEATQHHPNWANAYNQLEISLTTHDAGGVTQKDFDMAKTIDAIIEAK